MECTITWWSLEPVIMGKGLITVLVVRTIGICFQSQKEKLNENIMLSCWNQVEKHVTRMG